ncbi:MAG: protein-L-isoaspartate(D-aspartate) O-methyltransferase [Phycisphaerae bacterium]
MANGEPGQHEWSAERSAADERRRMVEEQVRARGVYDERVLDVMLRLPREHFLPPDCRDAAYEDRALPIGEGQTISQPFIVAYMTQKLMPAPSGRVLEIGTGTGYQTAVLALLCQHVFTVERIAVLQQRAAEALRILRISNVSMSIGDGSMGLAESAPFDGILVTAAAPRVPESLVNQLVDGGRLVVPVGGLAEQTIVVVVRDGPRTIETPCLGCRFVKLIGQEGWSSDRDCR